MIWYSTKSCISSTEGERFIFRQENSTLSAIRWICMGVIRMDSSTLSLALVMAAMILVISKVTSEPFRLMTVMLIFLHYILKGCTGHPQYFCSKRIITYNILRFKG